MVDLFIVLHGNYTATSTGFRVCCAINHTADPCMRNRTHAHDAGLQSDVQRDTGQPVIVLDNRALAQGNNFGMSRGVAVRNRSIVPFSEYSPERIHCDGTNRYFAKVIGHAGLLQRQGHEPGVIQFGNMHV